MSGATCPTCPYCLRMQAGPNGCCADWSRDFETADKVECVKLTAARAETAEDVLARVHRMVLQGDVEGLNTWAMPDGGLDGVLTATD